MQVAECDWCHLHAQSAPKHKSPGFNALPLWGILWHAAVRYGAMWCKLGPPIIPGVIVDKNICFISLHSAGVVPPGPESESHHESSLREETRFDGQPVCTSGCIASQHRSLLS